MSDRIAPQTEAWEAPFPEGIAWLRTVTGRMKCRTSLALLPLSCPFGEVTSPTPDPYAPRKHSSFNRSTETLRERTSPVQESEE